jgi:hypothetical protein
VVAINKKNVGDLQYRCIKKCLKCIYNNSNIIVEGNCDMGFMLLEEIVDRNLAPGYPLAGGTVTLMVQKINLHSKNLLFKNMLL